MPEFLGPLPPPISEDDLGATPGVPISDDANSRENQDISIQKDRSLVPDPSEAFKSSVQVGEKGSLSSSESVPVEEQKSGGGIFGGFFGKSKKSIDHLMKGSESEESSEKQNSDADLLYDSSDLGSLNQKVGKTFSLKNYTNVFSINLILILVLVGLGFAAYSFLVYLQEGSRPEISSGKKQEITQKTTEYYNKYGQKLGMFDLGKYSTYQLSDQGLDKIDRVLTDSSLNPVQKQDVLQEAASDLGSQIVQLHTDAKNLTEGMNKDGFFPEELVTILKTDDGVESLQRSLLSLEVVKFSSAMKVFSLMDVFLSSLSDSLGYTRSDVQERIQNLIARGERDVEVYLNMCYNNPYEPSNCTVINDFENYYKNFSKSILDQGFDTSFFKYLMGFIDNELEYSEMPNFAITFNSFDAKSSSIGFSIEVNTFKEDELSLIRQGVKSPHIFIVSELIKSLKQSTFIVGKAIDARDIKVNAKSVNIGTSKYVVNNSTKNFFLPIQKNAEREIFDFNSSYDTSILGEVEEIAPTSVDDTSVVTLLDEEKNNNSEGQEVDSYFKFDELLPDSESVVTENQELPLDDTISDANVIAIDGDNTSAVAN